MDVFVGCDGMVGGREGRVADVYVGNLGGISV